MGKSSDGQLGRDVIPSVVGPLRAIVDGTDVAAIQANVEFLSNFTASVSSCIHQFFSSSFFLSFSIDRS